MAIKVPLQTLHLQVYEWASLMPSAAAVWLFDNMRKQVKGNNTVFSVI